MEELLLRALLSGDELNIVHQKQIHVAVAGPEILRRALLDGLDHLIRELIALDIGDPSCGILLEDGLTDRAQQVRLAEAGVAVDEEWIVVFSRLVRHGQGGRMREFVGAADDEAVEGIAVALRESIHRFYLFLIILKLVSGQHQQIKVAGEEIGQGGLDGISEALENDIALEIGACMQDQTAVLDIDRRAVGKPGGDRGRRQFPGEDLQDPVPDFLKRIHSVHLVNRFQKTEYS